MITEANKNGFFRSRRTVHDIRDLRPQIHKKCGKKRVKNAGCAIGNGWLIWDETGKQKQPTKHLEVLNKLLSTK